MQLVGQGWSYRSGQVGHVGPDVSRSVATGPTKVGPVGPYFLNHFNGVPTGPTRPTLYISYIIIAIYVCMTPYINVYNGPVRPIVPTDKSLVG